MNSQSKTMLHYWVNYKCTNKILVNWKRGLRFIYPLLATNGLTKWTFTDCSIVIKPPQDINSILITEEFQRSNSTWSIISKHYPDFIWRISIERGLHSVNYRAVHNSISTRGHIAIEKSHLPQGGTSARWCSSNQCVNAEQQSRPQHKVILMGLFYIKI